MGTLTLTVHYDNAEALAQSLDYYADHIRYDREAGWPVIPGAVTISNAPGYHHGVLIQTLPSPSRFKVCLKWIAAWWAA